MIAPDAMPAIWRGAHPDSAARLAVSLGSRGDVEVWDWRIAPGEVFAAGVDPPGTQKLLFVLDGVLTVRLAERLLRVPAGHGARLPGDRPHGYENRDEQPLHFVGTVVLGTIVRDMPEVPRTSPDRQLGPLHPYSAGPPQERAAAGGSHRHQRPGDENGW